MSSTSENSDAEDLPRVPFVAPSVAQRRAVLVLSSDSEEELPLLQRLAAPLSRDAAAPPAVSAAPRVAPKDKPANHSAPRHQSRPPPPKRAKRIPESLTIQIDTVLLQGTLGGQVLSALQAQDHHCVIQPQPVARSITWSRSGEDFNGEPFCQEEEEMLVLVPGEDFFTMVQNSKTWGGRQVSSRGAVLMTTGKDFTEPHFNQSTDTLSSFVSRIMLSKSRAILTLVILEVEKYFKDQKSKGRKKLQQVVRGEVAKERRRKQKDVQELPKLSRVDVEAVMAFQLQTDVHVWFLETWKEFSDFVCMFSKALAEAPTKRQRDNTSFSFYLDGDWASGVRVEKCGKGLLEVWKRQIQQFNRVSVEVASAVVAAYPSPQLLIKAYRRCLTDPERHNLLSDILVRRGEGVTSTSRRIGPELSKRIYLQFMSSEPELSLDS